MEQRRTRTYVTAISHIWQVELGSSRSWPWAASTRASRCTGSTSRESAASALCPGTMASSLRCSPEMGSSAAALCAAFSVPCAPAAHRPRKLQICSARRIVVSLARQQGK